MAAFNTFGKLPHDVITRTVFPHLGAERSEILAGPGHGADTAVIDIGCDRVLVATTDIMQVFPGFGLEDAAWFAWQITGNDITTCGRAPQYIMAVFTVPADLHEGELATLCRVFGDEATKYGAAVIGGHTGAYNTSQWPNVGTFTMMTICGKNEYVATDMAQEGDVLVLTKGIGLSACAAFARLFPLTIRKIVGEGLWGETWNMFYQSSSMKDALIASSIGIRDEGVTAMHDITEGGIYTSLVEWASVANVGMWVDRDRVVVSPAARAVCEGLDIDPYSCSSVGSLLIAVKPGKVRALIDSLGVGGVEAAAIGEVRNAVDGVVVESREGNLVLNGPTADSIWPAMTRCMEEGMR
jgi:hydrogenase expression/formation protein HypE